MRKKLGAIVLILVLALCIGVVPVVASTETNVYVDIKPGSCPNPLNVNSKGVLPVAILGTEDFDPSMVDPTSVLLEGVAPLRWAWEDVATPYSNFDDLINFDGCHELGADGYLDLVLIFDNREVVEAIDGVTEDGEVRFLMLTGVTHDGFPIMGGDVVLILKKGADN